MSSELLDPTAPFVWPETRILSGDRAYRSPVPFESQLRKAHGLLGSISGMDSRGLAWLQDLLHERSELQCRIVLAVYAACPTHHEDLAQLLELQTMIGPRATFRIFLSSFSHASGAPANTLCCLGADEAQALFLVGSSPIFGLTGTSAEQVNFVFPSDPVLLDAWRKWFDWLWLHSMELTQQTIEIPSLHPAPGTHEAAAMWQAYITQCREALPASVQVDDNSTEVSTAQAGLDTIQVVVDPESGEVTAKATDGTSQKTPTQELEVPCLDRVAEKVTRLCRRGDMVSIDKNSRIRPLDTPIRADWFGVESLRQIGTVSREIKYRISAIDEKILRKLDNIRNRTRELLGRLSFPMGVGVWWMPHAAKALFEQEMHRVNGEGQVLLKNILRGSVEEFVRGQRNRIMEDANRMYKEFHPRGRLSEAVIDEILTELKERLTKAGAGRFLPQVTFTPIHFMLSQNSSSVSPWGQALTLLHAIAEFPRKCLSDPFFLRSLHVNWDQLFQAMDVCEDSIVSRRSDAGMGIRAKAELALLEEIMKTSVKDRLKCEVIFDLFDGAEREAIQAKLAAVRDNS